MTLRRAVIALAAIGCCLGATSAVQARTKKKREHHHHHQRKSHGRHAGGGAMSEGKAHLKRANELLGVTLEDVDWGGQLVYVVSKGTRIRQPVPASPDAFRYLGRYLATDGLPSLGEPVWRTRRGQTRPMTYWAIRRVLQRANEQLGTNWTLHDARHTAATRMEPRSWGSVVHSMLREPGAVPSALRSPERNPLACPNWRASTTSGLSMASSPTMTGPP